MKIVASVNPSPELITGSNLQRCDRIFCSVDSDRKVFVSAVAPVDGVIVTVLIDYTHTGSESDKWTFVLRHHFTADVIWDFRLQVTTK